MKQCFTADAGEEKGPVVMATVEGDIHDIGKNIVKVVLESYGYRIIDLGKDVKIEKVAEAWKKYQPKAIGLSALMTTTVISMEKTIQRLREEDCSCPIWVGAVSYTHLDVYKRQTTDCPLTQTTFQTVPSTCPLRRSSRNTVTAQTVPSRIPPRTSVG